MGAPGESMYCLEVEVVCLTFAFIYVILSSIGLVTSLVLLICFVIPKNFDGNCYCQIKDTVFEYFKTLLHLCSQFLGLEYYIVLGIWFTIALVAFAFAIVLVNGIVKKHIGLLKAYIIYGIYNEILIGIMTTLSFKVNTVAGVRVLSFSIIYLLNLILIWQTYRKFRPRAAIFQNAYQLQIIQKSTYRKTG